MEGEAADQLRTGSRARRARVEAARAHADGLRSGPQSRRHAGIALTQSQPQDPAALRLGVRLLNHAKATRRRINLLCGSYVLISDPHAAPGSTFSAVRRRRVGEAVLLPREAEERPGIAIETLRPYDRYADVVERVADLFDAGVGQVWILDPLSKNVSVHVPGYPVRTLEGDDELACEAELPGFGVRTRLVFEG